MQHNQQQCIVNDFTCRKKADAKIEQALQYDNN